MGKLKKAAQMKVCMKSKILILINTILIISCGHSAKKVSMCNEKSNKDSLIYSLSANILGDKYRVDYWSNYFLYVVNSSNDTIINYKELGIAPQSLMFQDFDNDGNLDIRYGYNSNYYYEMILLFDSKANGFKKIGGIDDPEYANSKNIKGTNLYYSYSPDGCGKSNWISRLFQIVNFKIIPSGLIRYKQCDGDEKGIFIYDLNRNKETLVKRFSLTESDKHAEPFNEYYWINNYSKFKK